MAEQTIFVACAPGLEPLLVDELRSLGLASPRAIVGGVELRGGASQLYRVLIGCGLGLRVLVRIGAFVASDFARLEREAKRIDWAAWIDPRRGVEVRASARRSRLYHTGAIAERIERAIAAQLGPLVPPAEHESRARVQVRIERDRCEVSIDVTGAPLHKRGWRLQTGKAPLREDIARALLLLAGFERGMALIDPMCGAGTLVIEAATIAAGLAPGQGRRFAIMDMPGFDAELFARERDRVAELLVPSEPTAILLGRDRDAGAIASARANAERAGVAPFVRFEQGSVGQALPATGISPGAGGLALITNPPWGQRVGDVARLRNLYASIGNFARVLEGLTHIGLATPDRALAGATGLELEDRVWTDHGGTRLGLWTRRAIMRP